MRDISLLTHNPLKTLILIGTRVEDISALKQTQIFSLSLDYEPARDREILLELQTLTHINGLSVDEFFKTSNSDG